MDREERCINQIGQLPNVVAHIRGDSWTSHNVYYVIVGAAARRRMAGPVPGNPPGTACAPDDAGRVRATARPRRQRTTARRRGPNADAARTSHAGIPTPAGSGSAFLQHLANQHLANPAARADRPGPCRIALTTPSPRVRGKVGMGAKFRSGRPDLRHGPGAIARSQRIPALAATSHLKTIQALEGRRHHERSPRAAVPGQHGSYARTPVMDAAARARGNRSS